MNGQPETSKGRSRRFVDLATKKMIRWPLPMFFLLFPTTLAFRPPKQVQRVASNRESGGAC